MEQIETKLAKIAIDEIPNVNHDSDKYHKFLRQTASHSKTLIAIMGCSLNTKLDEQWSTHQRHISTNQPNRHCFYHDHHRDVNDPLVRHYNLRGVKLTMKEFKNYNVIP